MLGGHSRPQVSFLSRHRGQAVSALVGDRQGVLGGDEEDTEGQGRAARQQCRAGGGRSRGPGRPAGAAPGRGKPWQDLQDLLTNQMGAPGWGQDPTFANFARNRQGSVDVLKAGQDALSPRGSVVGGNVVVETGGTGRALAWRRPARGAGPPGGCTRSREPGVEAAATLLASSSLRPPAGAAGPHCQLGGQFGLADSLLVLPAGQRPRRATEHR